MDQLNAELSSYWPLRLAKLKNAKKVFMIVLFKRTFTFVICFVLHVFMWGEAGCQIAAIIAVSASNREIDEEGELATRSLYAKWVKTSWTYRTLTY